MKAIYEFEQELLNEYDFEPMIGGYCIDDLNESDRQQLSGMLWILFGAIRNWEASESVANNEYGTIGAIANEYLAVAYDRLIDEIVSSVQEFVVSRLDSYVE